MYVYKTNLLICCRTKEVWKQKENVTDKKALCHAIERLFSENHHRNYTTWREVEMYK